MYWLQNQMQIALRSNDVNARAIELIIIISHNFHMLTTRFEAGEMVIDVISCPHDVFFFFNGQVVTDTLQFCVTERPKLVCFRIERGCVRMCQTTVRFMLSLVIKYRRHNSHTIACIATKHTQHTRIQSCFICAPFGYGRLRMLSMRNGAPKCEWHCQR